MNRIRRLIIVVPSLVVSLALTGLLGGCGFQPRGSNPSTGEVPGRIMINGLSTYDPLYRTLSSELSRVGSSTVGESSEADAVLHLFDQLIERRVLTLDSSAKVIEYELEQALRFRLTEPDGTIRVEDQRVRVLRIAFAPPSGVLGYSREIDEIRADMRRDLARKILNRIAAQY